MSGDERFRFPPFPNRMHAALTSAWQEQLAQARHYIQCQNLESFLLHSQQLIDAHPTTPEALLDIGALLQAHGFLGAARECMLRVAALLPHDPRAVANLANLARDSFEHAEARRLYSKLESFFPDHAAIRRNALLSLEYDPAASGAERIAAARNWSAWACAQAGIPQSRPSFGNRNLHRLRIGYLSADFCQHTVGLLVKDVLQRHDRARVEVFAYHAGATDDWVSAAIRASCTWRVVAGLNDHQLAQQIRADNIDVLVDLSGHTAGSRLTVFAHRPAPVQVSWLGYFASTGLDCIDAVLLDDAHAPPAIDAQFVEPVIRMAAGRWCYVPVPFAPLPAALPPCSANDYVTFGCFNNSAKWNLKLFEAWAAILKALPTAHLRLKWQTLRDPQFCAKVRTLFTKLGIDAERIALRGPSFHADLLAEYAEIDIALDPFPFSGGLTSCETLWMGVPIVTLPQSRVVSRQTFGLLSALDLTELVAQDVDDYIAIAVRLAQDPQRLIEWRQTLRPRMQASPLCDVAGFTRGLENTLFDLVAQIQKRQLK